MNLMRDFGMKQMANLSREFKLIKLTYLKVLHVKIQRP